MNAVLPVPALELRDRMAPVRHVGGGEFVPHFKTTRNGDVRDSMLLVAPLEVSAPIDDISGAYMLEGIATHVYNVGDGLELEILLVESGRARKIFARYYDPGRRAEDRAWLPFSVPLDLGRGGKRSLELRISAGPQGDLTADWLALGYLRLVPRGDGS